MRFSHGSGTDFLELVHFTLTPHKAFHAADPSFLGGHFWVFSLLRRDALSSRYFGARVGLKTLLVGPKTFSGASKTLQDPPKTLKIEAQNPPKTMNFGASTLRLEILSFFMAKSMFLGVIF